MNIFQAKKNVKCKKDNLTFINSCDKVLLNTTEKSKKVLDKPYSLVVFGIGLIAFMRGLMLNQITKDLKIICDNKVNDTAMLNILQAKLMQIMSFKNIKFQSIQNIDRPMPLAYYAFNFVPSGGAKNRPLDELNLHLLSFFNDYLKKYNEDRFDKLECDWTLRIQKITDKVELRRKKMECESELKAFIKLPQEITNATQAKLYKFLEIIKEATAGSVLIINTEFANYYEDAILNKDKMKKEFLDMLYNLYDGSYQAADTVTTSRENINGVPASLIFMSDYKLIKDDNKLQKAFLSYLARGMARRSFIYFKNNENYYSSNMEYPSFDEKAEAIEDLKKHAANLKLIFNQIEEGKEYFFNQAANEEINNYKKEVDKKIAEFYKYTSVLNLNKEILKLNLEHSTWKIIKLAVLYHVLDNPNSKFVSVEDFRKAVDFFNKTHLCLKEMLNDKLVSDYDELYNYLIENRNKFVSKMELRNQRFVSNREFKMWFDDALQAVQQMAEAKEFKIVTRITGKNNSGFEVCIYEPDKYKFIEHWDGSLQKGDLFRVNTSELEVSEL